MEPGIGDAGFLQIMEMDGVGKSGYRRLPYTVYRVDDSAGLVEIDFLSGSGKAGNQ